MSRIYLDYNASTPIAPEVAALMRELLEDAFGNPSSPHWAGMPAREIVNTARSQVARLLGCDGSEVVFTSGGSESNNLAIKGAYFASSRFRKHIITTRIEHPAVTEPCRFLERLGARITWLEVDGSGRIDPDDVRRAISADTILISIMHANNEVGTIEPIEACSAIAREHGIPLHTDAAQSVGKIRTEVDALGVDLLTIAGHKLYAPKGIGALYIRHGSSVARLAPLAPLVPLIHGAGHEGGRRAGTESALLTAALGQAAVLAADLSDQERVRSLRDRLWNGLSGELGNRVVLNGHPELRLPNTLNVCFVGRVGAEVLAELDGVAASTGSACHAGRVELSPVLAAMQVSTDAGMGAVRFSLGRWTRADEVASVVDAVVGVLMARGRGRSD